MYLTHSQEVTNVMSKSFCAVKVHNIKVNNKIRDLFKVKLYKIRSETKKKSKGEREVREREREKKRERKRERERERER